MIFDYAINYLGPVKTSSFVILLMIQGIITSLGGTFVLAGAYLLRKKRNELHVFSTRISAGLGLVGFILLFTMIILGHKVIIGTAQLVVEMVIGVSGLGVLLSIFGSV